jgi:hypothetical protein
LHGRCSICTASETIPASQRGSRRTENRQCINFIRWYWTISSLSGAPRDAGIGQAPQCCRRADLTHRRLRLSRPLAGVTDRLSTVSPRRDLCLASRRENPVKPIPYQRETISVRGPRAVPSLSRLHHSRCRLTSHHRPRQLRSEATGWDCSQDAAQFAETSNRMRISYKIRP